MVVWLQNAEAGVAGGDREQGMGAAGHTLGGPAGNGALGPEKEDAEEPHFESGFAARGRGAGAGAHRGGGRKGRGGMGRGMLRRFKEERTVEREEEDYFEKDGDDDSPYATTTQPPRHRACVLELAPLWVLLPSCCCFHGFGKSVRVVWNWQSSCLWCLWCLGGAGTRRRRKGPRGKEGKTRAWRTDLCP